MTKQQQCAIVVLSQMQQGGEILKKKRTIHKPYNKFKVWLKDNNVTYTVLGDLLGITATSVMYKINGQSDFLLSEIQIIKAEYQLKDEIFSTENVA